MDRCAATLLLACLAAACSGEERPPQGTATPDAFLSHLKTLAAGTKADVLRGTGQDLLWVDELRSLGAGEFWGDAAQQASTVQDAARRDPLPAILDVDAQLDAAGIEWLFVPVPAKVAVDPSLVPGAPQPAGRADVNHARFYALLQEKGVPVLDIAPALRELVDAGERAHCRTDTHWSGAACARAARLVREKVGSPAWLASAPKTEYRVEKKSVVIDGDMRKGVEGEAPPQETLELELVRDARGASPKDDAASPVLLLGDSHCLVFHTGGDMHAEGAGFADHLARELGVPIDVAGVRGSGATPSRVDVRRRDKLAGKKLVIWCLTVREFTSGQGWAKVPLKKE